LRAWTSFAVPQITCLGDWERGQRGCLLELSWNGTDPVKLPDGSTRAWLEDSDAVSITATAPGPDGTRIGLGEARGQILPAIPEPGV